MPARATIVGTALLSSLLVSSLVSVTAAAESREAVAPEPRTELPAIANDAVARDTIFNVASAVPAAGVVRATIAAGSDRSGAEGELGGSFAGGLLWSIGAGFATELTGTARSGGAYPAVGLRWQWLEQSRAGLDVMTAVRYGTFASELTTNSGGQIGAQLAVGRSLGRLQLTANAAVARGVIVRTDALAIAGAAALVDVVASRWRVGLDARARLELGDTHRAVEDAGRPVDLVAGAVSGHRYGPIYIQVLGGWQAPRGPAEAGPVALASVSADF